MLYIFDTNFLCNTKTMTIFRGILCSKKIYQSLFQERLVNEIDKHSFENTIKLFSITGQRYE